MLIHVVCFKYRTDVDEDARKAHREQLSSLSGLEGIVDLKVGQDLIRSARSYDTGLVVTFTDRAALDRYQANPEHVPIAKHGASLSDHIVAVDFEA